MCRLGGSSVWRHLGLEHHKTRSESGGFWFDYWVSIVLQAHLEWIGPNDVLNVNYSSCLSTFYFPSLIRLIQMNEIPEVILKQEVLTNALQILESMRAYWSASVIGK